MIYLLDVNALIALGSTKHQFHSTVTAWIAANNYPDLATCSITELGFVRVLSQPLFGWTVTDARALLLGLKTMRPHPLSFITDDHDISHLPPWVKTSKDTTDGHLAELAKTHGALLATLDKSIPGSYLINE